MPIMPSPFSNNEGSAPGTSRWDKPFLKIGHGGASGHAPANTLQSLELALEMGVDVVEFDVRPCRDTLVLLHDDSLSRSHRSSGLASLSTLAELRALSANPELRIATLTEALDLLKGKSLINIDLKAAGYEREVVETVLAKGIAGDVIYSSVIPSSLRRVRQEAPGAMIGLSFPEDRGDASTKPYLKPVVEGVVAAMRISLPYRILSMMANAGANAVMLYHKVVSRSAIIAVQRAGGKVFTWTVDEAKRMRKLRDLGVNGITTNYPELFNSGELPGSRNTG